MHPARARRSRAAFLGVAMLAGTSACISPGEPKPLRYYRAELASAAPAPASQPSAVQLRVRSAQIGRASCRERV